MIHYMPFTFISDEQMRRLYRALGPFSVCQLSPSLTPIGMQPWIQDGRLHGQYPQGLDSARLQAAIKEFQQWGALHEGRLAALARVYPPGGHAPLVDDTAPTRISTWIRRFLEEPEKDRDQAPELFPSALFAALAQIYDEQQDYIDAKLTEARRLEARMISQLVGDPLPGLDHAAGASTGSQTQDQDRGGLFTSRRIEAWAGLAACLEQPAYLYVTCSARVYQYMLDALPEAVELWSGPLSAADASQANPLRSAVLSMATADDPSLPALEWAASCVGNDPPAELTLHTLPGRRPYEVLSRLSGQAGPDPWPQSPLQNTILGHLIFKAHP